MKNTLDNVKVIHSDNLSDILPNVSERLEFPYTEDFLMLCKRENPFKQEYYYIERGEDYAFFIVYYNKLNIFTLGKKELFMNVKTIGLPCSLSDEGFLTNNLSFMLDYIKTIKGGKLVLNVIEPKQKAGIVLGETLPTCVFQICHKSIEEYIGSLRSGYRRRLNLAIKRCQDMEVKYNDSTDIHRLYLNTYEKSDYKLERLEKGFFEQIDANKIVFYRNNKPAGFVLLKEHNNKLIFMLCGMDYEIATADLYYYMLYTIIKYGIERNMQYIDLGQTSEQTKLRFGAVLEKRYFYAIHSNPFWALFAKAFKPLLEYSYSFPEYNVYKES